MPFDIPSTGLAARFSLCREDLLPIARQAMQKLVSGQAGEGFDLFARLVLVLPGDHGFQIGLAEAALAADQPDVALQAATAAIAFAPDKADGYLLSGRACMALDELDAARSDFTESVTRAEATPNDKDQNRAGTLARSLLIALAGVHA